MASLRVAPPRLAAGDRRERATVAPILALERDRFKRLGRWVRPRSESVFAATAAATTAFVLLLMRLARYFSPSDTVLSTRPAGGRALENGMSIVKKAGVPAVTVDPSASVLRAVRLMKDGGVDTLFVLDGDELRGAFTQRDLAFRVVLARRDPERTAVSEVMTSPAVTVAANATIADAVVVMAEHGVSQLPIVDDEGAIKGMVRLRDIFREQKIDLTAELDSLSAYYSADGIGG